MRKSKKIIAGIMAVAMTGVVSFPEANITVPAIKPVNNVVYAAEKGEAEKFIESAENKVNASIYTGDADRSFNVNGRTYYQGVVLGNGNYNCNAGVSFNVENVDSISFDFGHVDWSSSNEATISIYLDDVLTEQFKMNGYNITKECSIDVSNASKMRITSSSDYSKYAMANISVDEAKAATPAVIPEYETAEDFVRGNYNGSNITAVDDSDSPNAVDRKSIHINGRTYYQGVILGNGNYNCNAAVSFNVENVDNISFDFGHVDWSSSNEATISIYLDDVLTEQFKMNGYDITRNYSIDVSDASKMRITSSSDYSKYAMANISVDGAKAATPAVIPEYETAEDFVRGNYNGSNITAIDDSDSPNAIDRKSININGRTYYQGVILGNGNYNCNAAVSFNVENVDNISFDFGHVDWSSSNEATISIYLDDVLTEQFKMNGYDITRNYSIDVSDASKMRITSSSDYSKYAMANISVDGAKAATPAVIPEYETAEDFVRGNYNGSNITAVDDSDSPNAVDRKSIHINGRTYYQGVILGNGNYNCNAAVSFNVENVDSISFDFGHVDDSKSNKSTISIYLDNVMKDRFEVTGDEAVKSYSIDVSNASKLRITSSSDYSKYAMGNISISSSQNPDLTTTTITTSITQTTTTTTSTGKESTTTKTTVQLPDATLFGDTNNDGDVNISDAVLIMQSIANPDEYRITKQGRSNADVVDNGNGVTNIDALAIQYIEIKTIQPDDFPLTSTELDALNK